MNKFQKAPIVYQGNKFRLLKKIAPFFPENIDLFVDVFGGSSTMALNFGERALYNEKNEFIGDMIKTIYTKKDELLKIYKEISTKFEMFTKTKNKEEEELFKNRYNKMREYVNNLEYGTLEHIAGIYTCHVYAINNLIRFNKSKKFNASAGFRMENSHPEKKLEEFVIPKKEILFFKLDFRDVLDWVSKDTNENLFVYLDPPYSGTTAVYNENRLTGWSNKDDKDLWVYLDMLDMFGVQWAYSNTLTTKSGETKEELKKWADKYNINYLNHNYASFGNSNRNNEEVLITNYEKESK